MATTLVGIAVLFVGIILPWWTFPPTMWNGGPRTLYGWQFGAIAALPLVASVPTVVAIAPLKLLSVRARRLWAVLLLVLTLAAIALSWAYLGPVWLTNCSVECFGPIGPKPGIGLVLLAFGATLPIGANLWRERSAGVFTR